MNASAILNSRAAQWAAVALVGAVIAYVVVKRLGDAADKALDNFNAGTPYGGYSADSGLAGSAAAALGNVTNQASGGTLARFGEWLSETFFDPNSDYDPNAGSYAPRKSQVRSLQ